MTRYGFRSAFGAFFHADGALAQARLPGSLRAVETHPGLAVLALTLFDFDASEVGAYRELVASIVVAPHAPRGASLPDAAFFPVFLATSTPASREHAAQRWCLPKLDRCLDFVLDAAPDPAQRSVTVHDGGEHLLSLRVSVQPRERVIRRYQCFSCGVDSLCRVELDIEAPLAEHEDELGELELGDSPLSENLRELLDDLVPFREQIVDAGEQRFGELQEHGPLRRPA